MSSDKRLHIYLSDHLAGATAGLELAKRSLSSNRGTELGDFLRSLVGEITGDRKVVEDIIERVGGRKDPVKIAGAWTAEKVGRLKLNGQLRGYSPLSRLVELEGLCVGVEGKLSLWRSLKQQASADSRLADFDFDTLIDSAQTQRATLETHRLEAAKTAFA